MFTIKKRKNLAAKKKNLKKIFKKKKKKEEEENGSKLYKFNKTSWKKVQKVYNLGTKLLKYSLALQKVIWSSKNNFSILVKRGHKHANNNSKIIKSTNLQKFKQGKRVFKIAILKRTAYKRSLQKKLLAMLAENSERSTKNLK